MIRTNERLKGHEKSGLLDFHFIKESSRGQTVLQILGFLKCCVLRTHSNNISELT